MFFKVAQIIIVLVLTGLVLLQSREGGLSNTLGALGGFHSRRGIERVVFWLTIISAIAFVLNSLYLVLLAS